MKNLIFLALVALLFASCGPVYRCQPSKRSKDYAKRQWTQQRSDGYFVVTTMHGFTKSNIKVFECKPDSSQLAAL
jgi:hypothetical protein